MTPGEMPPVKNGMKASALGPEGWAKPWSGPDADSCVEVKRVGSGFALRQSADATSPALILSRSEFVSFINAVKAGEADFLLG
jgi:hypothetical protein